MGTVRHNRPDFNIYRTGKLKGVFFSPNSNDPSKPDISVQGIWEPNPQDASGQGFAGGEGRFYIGAQWAAEFCRVGLIRYTGNGPDGNPQYKVVNPNQRMYVVIRKNGTRNVVTVSACDNAGNNVALPEQPGPSSTNGQAQPPQQEQQPGPGAPGAGTGPGPAGGQQAPPAAQPNAGTPAQPAPTPKKASTLATLAMWAALGDQALLSMRLAKRSVLHALGITEFAFGDLPIAERLRIMEIARPHADTILITAGRDQYPGFTGMLASAALINPRSPNPRVRATREILTLEPSLDPITPAPKPAAAAAGAGTVERAFAGGEDDGYERTDDTREADDDDLPF